MPWLRKGEVLAKEEPPSAAKVPPQHPRWPSHPTPPFHNGPSDETRLRGRQPPALLHNPFLHGAASAITIHGFVRVGLAEEQSQELTPASRALPASPDATPGWAGTWLTCWVTWALTHSCFAATSFSFTRFHQVPQPLGFFVEVFFLLKSLLLSIQIYFGHHFCFILGFSSFLSFFWFLTASRSCTNDRF